MAIKELLTLEGDDVVVKQLANVQKAGEAALKGFRDLGQTGAADTFQRLTQQLQQAGPAVAQAEQRFISLREGLRILNPILSQTGEAMGGLGAFARIAGTGIGGLAAAVVGAGAVKLQNLGDAAQKTRNQLSDLLGSTAGGDKAFQQLQQTAAQLGTSVEKLGPAFQSFIQAQKEASGIKFTSVPGAEGLGINAQKAIQPLTDLFTLLRANHATFDETNKQLADFGKTVSQQGVVTKDALAPLQQFPGLFDKIKSALGGAGQSNKAFLDSFRPLSEINKIAKETGNTGVNLDRVLRELGVRAEPSLTAFENALKRVKLQLPQTFDPAAPQSFSEAVDGLLQKLQDVFKPLQPAGGAQSPLTAFTVQATKDLQDFANTTRQEWNALQTLLSKGLEIAPPIVKSVLGDPLKNIKEEFNDLMALAPKFKAALDDALQFRQGLQQQEGEGPLALLNKNIDQANQDFTLFAEHVNQTLGQPPDLSAWGAGFQTAFDAAVTAGQAAWDRLQAIFAQPIKLNIDTGGFSGFGGQPLGAPFAGGGQVRGPGSTTSDSIMAFLSNREWVVNAKAVDFYGSSLFAALNSMRLPRNMLSMPKFAEGGQVQASGTPVHLHFGGQSFALSGNEPVLTQLRRVAVQTQLASIGRKPGFVR